MNLREAIGQALDVLDIPPFTANLHDFARVNSEAAHILRQAYSQPDQDDTALLLAEKLEQQFPLGTAQHYLDGEAAAELRRLHQSEREGWRYAKELEHERKELSALLRQAYLLCDEINKMPHVRGSINGMAVQLQYALREQLGEKA